MARSKSRRKSRRGPGLKALKRIMRNTHQPSLRRSLRRSMNNLFQPEELCKLFGDNR